MFTLPVSGAAIVLRGADGTDDMLLAEAAESPVEIGIALLSRLGGDALDARNLVVTDFEHLLLQVRAARFGHGMALGFACPHCRAVAEISFSIADFVAADPPRAVPEVRPHPSKAGWFSLAGAGFRLPTAGDQAAVAALALPEKRLAELCLDETARRSPHRARVERAMAAMAPLLSRTVAGDCPSCGARVEAQLAVANLVVGELKRAGASVHDEVDLIARAYHWPEALILALPPPRRRAYAERARRAPLRAA